MENTICVACGSICSKEVRAKNWGYVGKVDQVYTYMLCNCCDSLNRKKKDIDYGKIYDDSYAGYSKVQQLSSHRILRNLRKLRNSYAFSKRFNLIGFILNKLRPATISLPTKYVEELRKGKTLLDVGCRYGNMIYQLYEGGSEC